MSKPKVNDVDLWTAARKRFAKDDSVQIPIDGKIYRLEDGAWVDAKVWVDFEEEEDEG